ncbi:unnamed protein product [Lactuca saligna]|uniref:Uncharacterized protein n=1 Tax=Lactuca saligna TaxID=75948 RepID=A0AA36E672_LACSI|nr:unnamed protein product [Lactuca saligna]
MDYTEAGLLHVGVGHLLEAEALKEEEIRKHQHHHPIPMVELIPKALCSVLIPLPMGLMSTSHLEQEAAVLALSTLMTIAPAEVYAEFEKVV